MEQFIRMVDLLTIEWNEKGDKFPASFTAEFSTDRSLDQAKRKYLAKASKRMVHGSWRLFPCDVCKSHSHKDSIHVEINQWHSPKEHNL